MREEMRVIYADALEKMIDDFSKRGWTDWAKSVRKVIDEQPTVDAVPVVRCSECKHYKSVLCPLSMADGYYWPAHNPDFFCADGERREDHDEQT